MAIEKRGAYWYNTETMEYFFHEPVVTGDTVEYIGNRSSTYEKGELAVVSSVTRGSSDYTYIINNFHSGNRHVYTQTIHVRGSETKRSMKNWRKAEGKTGMLGIEGKTPVIVQEIEDVYDAEAKASVTKNVGNPMEFDSVSAARAYTSDEITKSIRESNKYRQFRIYKQDSIARAKKPEIEFA